MTIRTVDLTPRAFTTDANYDYYRSQLEESRARVADLEYAAREMLSTFTEAGHPGEPAVRSSWVNYETHLNWCRLINPE